MDEEFSISMKKLMIFGYDVYKIEKEKIKYYK